MFNEKSEQFKITKVTSELVVDVQPKEISIALLEDKALVEFQKEGRSASFNVGNMYLGRVKKLMPGLNACFVDVGFEKDAFLHYLVRNGSDHTTCDRKIGGNGRGAK